MTITNRSREEIFATYYSYTLTSSVKVVTGIVDELMIARLRLVLSSM